MRDANRVGPAIVPKWTRVDESVKCGELAFISGFTACVDGSRVGGLWWGVGSGDGETMNERILERSPITIPLWIPKMERLYLDLLVAKFYIRVLLE